MPHPMHIHGVRFRVIERRGRGPARDLADGILDTGFRDTVLVLPGEQVQVSFTPDEQGRFLYHCHNLEHEDGGMMRNLEFVG
ncbi:MAG: multicopper oxidase domain-containing protein [Betaproteobacteria bacterium]